MDRQTQEDMMAEMPMGGGQEEEIVAPVGEPEVTEEGEESLSIFLAQAIRQIHSKETANQLLAQIKNHPKPAMAIGDIAERIVSRLETEGSENGVDFPPEIVVAGSIKVIEELADLAVQTGVVQDFTEEDVKISVGQFVGQYFQNALKDGRISREELVALGQQFASNPEYRVDEEPQMPMGGGQ